MESEFKSHFPIFLDVQFRASYFISESSFLNTNTEIVTKLAGTLITDRGHNAYISFPSREHSSLRPLPCCDTINLSHSHYYFNVIFKFK